MTPTAQSPEESTRALAAKRRRRVIWATAIVLGCYVLWQLGGLLTTKDAAPPAWLIAVPADASVVGEPRIDYQPYRVTTYLTVRPAEGLSATDLINQMGLSAQPVQIGPTPLDWRPVWVYARPTQVGVEVRLVYRPDLPDGPAP